MGNILKLCDRTNKQGPKNRSVAPNHRYKDIPIRSKSHPNREYASNRIKTTKYSILTFLPKNLFEQFHRFANLYFIFVVALNWVPEIQAFGKEIAMVPVVFVLCVTGIKDAFEDYRRYRSDKKVNSSKCRVYSGDGDSDFQQVDWSGIHAGDVVHLSCNDIIPADILLLKSSDPQDICHIETMNLDGETNLKQRHPVSGLSYGPEGYSAGNFKFTIECEQPNTEIYKFTGFLKVSENENENLPLNSENIILRGCIMRNTDWIEGLVVYAGHETKSMMNNRNPRYKRSKLERALNRDVIWCVIILLFLCFFCAAGSAIWLGRYEDTTKVPFIPYESSEQFNPYFQAFIVFFTYIIIFQSVIPLPLYVSLELVKLLQVYFINSDLELYHEASDKRIDCRALNITEDLGQIEHVFSDKTGTLTENQMEFKSCTIGGRDYPHIPDLEDDSQSETESRYSLANSLANVSRTSSTMDNLKLESDIQKELSSMCLRSIGSVDLTIASGINHSKLTQDFFLLMALCNTVVVSAHAHEDPMDEQGHMQDSSGQVNKGYTPPEYPEKYTKLVDNALPKKLAPLDGYSPNNKENPLPPIPAYQEQDSTKYPLDAARREYMPSVSTPTTSIADSSIRSDMSRTRYEAESPDELALVRAASTYNCCLKSRTAETCTIWLPAEGDVEFEVLNVLHFDSTRKRMSVIVKHPLTKDIILYTKGADSSILSVLHKKYKEDEELKHMKQLTEEHILAYAMQGLRTLCMAKKVMSKAAYTEWRKKHRAAESAMEDRETKIMDSACNIECDLELLGATGIEDKLQEHVPETIYNLRQAGIKVWVLTGDKQETAIQVSYASALFSAEQEMIIVNGNDKEETEAIMKHHYESILKEEKHVQSPSHSHSTSHSSSSHTKEYGLVIDGKTMTFALSKSLERLFLALASKCNSVICCRSTPIQKGLVVRLVREELKVLTLAIGDGANDVSMIHMADIGIGISGQEGMQAVMASDFAIARFFFLERLLLVHGHWCYNRLARFSAFMFYKSLVSTMTLFWFNLYSGFSGATHIDSLLLLLQHVLFTAVPPIINGILDKDLSDKTLTKYPELYKIGPDGETYTRKTFLLIFLDAVFQSVMVHFGCYFAYFEGVGIWEYGTTMMVSLVLCILLHSCIETYTWVWPQWLCVILSFLSFWLFAIVIDSFFITFDHPVTPYWVMQNTISKPIHSLVVLISVFTALLPRFTMRLIQHTVFPDAITKAQLMEKKEREEGLDIPDTRSENISRATSPDITSESQAPNIISTKTGREEMVQENLEQPEVQFRNGKIRHRQNSNHKTSHVAESPT